MPALVSMKKTQQEILQFLINSQMNQAKESTLATEPASDDSVLRMSLQPMLIISSLQVVKLQA